MNDFLINGGTPVSLNVKNITFRNCNSPFQLNGELLETMTIYDFKVSHSNPQDQKFIFEFGKEMIFIIKQKGRKSSREKSRIKLLKSTAIMAFGISTIFLSFEPYELRDRLKWLLQGKQAWNNSDLSAQEFVALADKSLESKYTSNKQHKNLPLEGLNWMTIMKLIEEI